jgi:putative ABC transport system substrate-binding protein
MKEINVVIIAIIWALTFAHVAEAQKTKKIPRLGWLSVGHGPKVHPNFRQAMRELGWFHGQNIEVVTRFAKEQYDHLPKFAAELVQLNVDVIVAADSLAIPAAKNATSTIPIVMSVVGPPVSRGYVASLARPGGNVTGLTNDLGPVDGKRLQILKEAVPRISRVAIFDPTPNVDWNTLETVSRACGIELERLQFKQPDELESVFKTARSKRVNGLMVTPSPKTNFHRHKIIEFATRNALAGIYPLAAYVRDGGLMSYGPDLRVMQRRAAYYVDKILKGAKPSDLPVERPMVAEFTINLRAAKEIGITLPPEILQRADRIVK